MNKELQKIADNLISDFEDIRCAKDNGEDKGEFGYKERKIRAVEKFYRDLILFIIKENSLPFRLKEKVNEDVSTVKNVSNTIECDIVLYDTNDIMKYFFEVKDYIDATMYKRLTIDIAYCLGKYPNLVGVGLCLQPAMTETVRTGWDLQNEKMFKGFSRNNVAYFSLVDKQRVSKNITYILDYSTSDIYDRVQLLYNNLVKAIK